MTKQIKARIIIIAMLIITLIIVISNIKKVVIITGNSMEPTIHSNTIAFIKRTPIEEITKDDIICFKDNNMNIIHRVMSIYTNTDNNIEIRTKGDNNKKEDKTIVNKDNYIGELGISIWITDIFLEFLPKLVSLAIIIICGIIIKLRRYTNERN